MLGYTLLLSSISEQFLLNESQNRNISVVKYDDSTLTTQILWAPNNENLID